jgi:hypothetical protein
MDFLITLIAFLKNLLLMGVIFAMAFGVCAAFAYNPIVGFSAVAVVGAIAFTYLES